MNYAKCFERIYIGSCLQTAADVDTPLGHLRASCSRAGLGPTSLTPTAKPPAKHSMQSAALSTTGFEFDQDQINHSQEQDR